MSDLNTTQFYEDRYDTYIDEGYSVSEADLMALIDVENAGDLIDIL